MRLLHLFLISFCLISGNAFANCAGCCSGHKGTVCVNGQTKCKDGTDLSQKCKSKSCNACKKPQQAAKASTGKTKNIASKSKPDVSSSGKKSK